MSSDKRNHALVTALIEERRRKAEEDRKRKGKGKASEEVKAKEAPKGVRPTSILIREPGSVASPPAPRTVPAAKPPISSAKPPSAKTTTKALLKDVETPPEKAIVSAPKKTTDASAKKTLQVDLADTPKKSTTSVGETGKDASAGALVIYKPNRPVVCAILTPDGYSRLGMKPYKPSAPRKRKESGEVVPTYSKKPRVPKKPETVEEEVGEESEEEAGGLEIVIADDVAEDRAEEPETVEVASEEDEEEEKKGEEEEEKDGEEEEEKDEGAQTEAVYVPSTLIQHNVRRTVRDVTSPPLPPSARHTPLRREEEVPAVGEGAHVPEWDLREGDSVFSSTSAATEFVKKGLTPADRQRLENFSGIELGSLTISTACQVSNS